MILVITLLILVSVTLWIKWKRLAWAWPTSVLTAALLGAIFNHPWMAAFTELAIIIAFLVYFSKKTGKRLVVLPAGFKKDLRKVGISTAVVAGVLAVVVGLIAINVPSGSLNASEPPSTQTMPPAAAAPPVASAAATCQTDAITAYATKQGFTKGQYAVGANNADTSLSEFSSGGSLRFSQPITSQALLAKTFTSSEPAAQVAVQRVKSEFTNYSDSVLLNADNWQMVQWLVPTNLVGNTGFSNGKAVDAGTRSSAKGDAEWLFVDPATCKVPTATTMEATAYTVKTDNTQTTATTSVVPLIRVGCGNPGKNVVPVTPTPPTHTTPPPTCVQPASPGPNYTWNQGECTWIVITCVDKYGPGYTGPGYVGGKWICKDPGSDDPSQQGNNRPGGNGTAPPVTTPASPPAAGTPAPTYTAPAAPAPQPTQPPQVIPTPTHTSDPAPTVVPSTQPPNNGVIGDSGNPSSPDPTSTATPCNATFQSCP